jgi:peptide/nickel transport system permease protein
MRRFFSRWQNLLGLGLVLFFGVIALAAPILSPQSEKEPGAFQRTEGVKRTKREPQPPEVVAPLGSLPGQLDVFHALVWGTRDALTFGLQVTLATALFGVLLGAGAGLVGGWFNSLVLRIADSFLSFPLIAGVVFLEQLWLNAITASGGVFFRGQMIQEPVGGISPIEWLFLHTDALSVTIILFSWMPYARLTNAMVAVLKPTEFIQAAQALGASQARILFRHLIPNAVSPALVLAARDVGGMVVLQATLTFIGISSSSVWGTMLAMGRDWVIGPDGGIFRYWWVFLPTTLALTLFGVGWNLLGDGLSDLLDPRE